MKKILIGSLIAVAVVALVGSAAAEAARFKQGAMGVGFMAGGGYEAMLEAKANIFGMTVDQLKQEIAKGKTFLQIAQEKGISQEQLRIKMLEQKKTRLDSLVKSGVLTQDQANQHLEWMKEKQASGGCPMSGLNGTSTRGFGRMGGWR